MRSFYKYSGISWYFLKNYKLILWRNICAFTILYLANRGWETPVKTRSNSVPNPILSPLAPDVGIIGYLGILDKGKYSSKQPGLSCSRYKTGWTPSRLTGFHQDDLPLNQRSSPLKKKLYFITLPESFHYPEIEFLTSAAYPYADQSLL